MFLSPPPCPHALDLARYALVAQATLPSPALDGASALVWRAPAGGGTGTGAGTLLVLPDSGTVMVEVTFAGQQVAQMAMTNFADPEGMTVLEDGSLALSEERLGRAYRFTYAPGGTLNRNALQSIVVVSGLLGAVRADDRIPDYRLKMGARLAPNGLIAAWWHDHLSEVLNTAFVGRTVIDLLPNEHRRAFTPDTERLGDYIRVGLFEKSGKAGGHDAKAAKGRLARHVLITCTSASKARASIASFRDPRFVARID